MTISEENTLDNHLCLCGCKQQTNLYRKKPNRFIYGHNPRIRFRELNPRWKNGVYMKNGYRYIMRKGHPKADRDGYVQEHRLVYEDYHKCCLLNWSEIHHINGIRTDNRIENIQPMSKKQHSKLHYLRLKHK
jgi:hypothetical protein